MGDAAIAALARLLLALHGTAAATADDNPTEEVGK